MISVSLLFGGDVIDPLLFRTLVGYFCLLARVKPELVFDSRLPGTNPPTAISSGFQACRIPPIEQG